MTHKCSYKINTIAKNIEVEVKRLQAQVDLFWEKEVKQYKLHGLRDGMSIIEFGCGPGYVVQKLLETFPNSFVTAVEIDPYLAEFAKQHLAEKDFKNFYIIQGSILSACIKENSFDFAIARLVLEHLPNPYDAVREVYRVLKVGGKGTFLDNDFVMHLKTYPPIPELRELYHAYRQSRYEEGGNPKIGRELPILLKQGEFVNIDYEIISAHSSLIGVDPFLRSEGIGIASQLVHDGYLSGKKMADISAKWRQMLNAEHHGIVRQLSMAVGEKCLPYKTDDYRVIELKSTQLEQNSPQINVSSKLNLLPELPYQKKPCVEQSLSQDENPPIAKIVKRHISELLSINPESVRQNTRFIEIGITSVLAVDLIERLNSELDLTLGLEVVFEYNTIKELIRLIKKDVGQIDVASKKRIINALNTQSQSRPAKTQSYAFKDISKSKSADLSDVAIIGMQGRLPQSENLNQFWEHLLEGKDLITQIPKNRFDLDALDQPLLTKWGGFLKDVDKFDHLFFGISPHEAERIEPEQRLLLQIVWQAIEDAGYNPLDLSGRKIGVFVAASVSDYNEILAENGLAVDAATITGMQTSIIANRISYCLNLKGPSEVVDTACSSVGVAMHRAIMALQQDECQMCICGGINLLLTPTKFNAFGRGGMLSDDGKTRTFDKNAHGFVRGEGGGAFLLKPLSQAIQDQDPIYAIIKASSVNHGGRSRSLSDPNASAQTNVIVEAFRKAQINPDTVGYIEAQGASTVLGDPIEINAYKKAFQKLNDFHQDQSRQRNYCGIGSVKPNVGHLEQAAGIASLFKVILSLKHKKIPKTIYLNQINPHIDIQSTPFYLVNQTKEWIAFKNDAGKPIPRRAGIHFFGIGGTNAHLVLEEYQHALSRPLSSYSCTKQQHIIVLSAKSQSQLVQYLKKMREFIKHEADLKLGDVAYTLQLGREVMSERIAFIVESKADALEKIDQILEGKIDQRYVFKSSSQSGDHVFTFIEEDEDINFLIRQWMEKKKMSQLAELWVNGIHIDWTQLYRESNDRRISLPTYPFAEKSFWISDAGYHSRHVNGVSESSKGAVEPPETDKNALIQHITSVLSILLKYPEDEIVPDLRLADLGLNSMYAMRLLHRLQHDYGQKLPLKPFLKCETVFEITDFLIQNQIVSATRSKANFSGCASHLASFDTRPSQMVQPSRNREGSGANKPAPDGFPLSEMQKAFWIYHQADPESYAFNTPAAFWVNPEIDLSRLKWAIEQVCIYHPVLRAQIDIDPVGPVQKIYTGSTIDIEEKNISMMVESEALDFIAGEAKKPFILVNAPLMRTVLYQLKDKQHVILFNFHHIIFDGVSLEIFLDTLFHYYTGKISNEPAAVCKIKRTYADFVSWQSKMINGAEGKSHHNYWEKQMAGGLPTIDLALDFPLQNSHRFKGATYHINIEKSSLVNLPDFLNAHHVTAFSLLLAVFKVLLYRYTSQKRIIVGTAMAARPDIHFDSVIGCFMNMVPISSQFENDPAFLSLLNHIHEHVLETVEHSTYPLYTIVESILDKSFEQRDDHGDDPAFQTAFYFQNWNRHLERINQQYQVDLNQSGSPFFLEPVYEIHQEGEYVFALEVMEGKDVFRLHFKYNPHRFQKSTIIRMADHYINILNDILAAPQKKLSDISVLGPEEKNEIVSKWNATQIDYPHSLCAHDLFEQQVQKRPDKIAVIYEGDHITYEQLNTKADFLAKYLIAQGFCTGSYVGIFLERSIDMLVSLLAVFKSGAAYVPLDPIYPPDRIAYIVNDTQMPVLLVHSFIENRLPPCKAQLIRIDQEWGQIEDTVNKNSHIKLEKVSPQQVANILYTSGSTGKPKGVQVRHQGLTNFLCAMAIEPGCTENDRILALTTICFDIAELELFLPLITGGQVEILSTETTRDGIKLRDVIENSPATIVQATPVTWQMLIAAEWNVKRPIKILCGGEPLSQELAGKLLQLGNELWNMFGPTETTIWSSVQRIISSDQITIGRPIANTEFYILDPYMNPVPIGVAGELLIGGAGLAEGYLNQPTKTARAFIRHPLKKEGGEKIYRTGDLARYLADGRVEYLGRIDTQVKIRGFRIELGEIEAVLQKINQVAECVVVVRVDKTGHKQLVAFIKANTDFPTQKLSRAQFTKKLQKWLPDYMIPYKFVYLDRYPLTLNRKIDRKELTRLPFEDILSKFTTIPAEMESVSPVPQGKAKTSGNLTCEVEKDPSGVSKTITCDFNIDTTRLDLVQNDLLMIVSSILSISSQDIDLNTQLGEYGFDSFRFTTLSVQLKKKYQITVSPPTFYEHATISALATYFITHHQQAMDKHYRNEWQTDLLYTDKQTSFASKNGREKKHAAAIETIATSGGRFKDDLNDPNHNDVAIIGMSGKMPQSDDLNLFWRNLAGGVDMVTEISAYRKALNPHYARFEDDLSYQKTKWGGFLENIDTFDAKFFKISPREAELMDPQQRLFLEVAWETIENAGYDPKMLAGSRTGIFVGVTNFDYWELLGSYDNNTQAHAITGLAHSIIANRVSYQFDFRGPSETINTACSSSLIAIHQAVESILRGDCELALCGGVNVILSPYVNQALAQTDMLSPDGRCMTFDQRANGYVRGEGVGAILLKPLAQAEKDQDHIYAVIKGSAENHGGRTNSLTSPNPKSQAEVIIRAHEKANLDPAHVSYLEMHGTGTRLGDPVEINGVKMAFQHLYRKWDKPFFNQANCGLGSVKSNMGHLEAAAGIAGVIKVIFAFMHQTLPSNLHFKHQNKYIDLDNSPFYIVSKSRKWLPESDQKGKRKPKCAGISSFGFGGANAHVVLSEYLSDQSELKPNGLKSTYTHALEKTYIFVLSASDSDRLKAYVHKILQFLKTHGASDIIPDEAPEIEFADIIVYLRQTLGPILNIDIEQYKDDDEFAQIGLDIVGASVFVDGINKTYDLDLVVNILSEYSTLLSLARFIAKSVQNPKAHDDNASEALESIISLRDFIYTLQVSRGSGDERIAILISSFSELMLKLEQYLENKNSIPNLFYGRTTDNQDAIEILTQGHEGTGIIKSLIDRKQWDKICSVWSAGAVVPWHMLYQGVRPRRIPLPTYPFEKTRYWVPGLKNGMPAFKCSSPGSPQVSSTDHLENISKTVTLGFLEKDWQPSINEIRATDPQKANLNLKHRADKSVPVGVLLILAGADTNSLLDTIGHTPDPYLPLRIGHSRTLQKKSTDEYVFHFGQQQQVTQFLSEISHKHGPIVGLLDFSDLAVMDPYELEKKNKKTIPDPQKSLSDDFMDKLVFIQCLIQSTIGNSLHILHFTNGLQSFKSSQRSLSGARMAGFMRMLGVEYAHLTSKTIDIDFSVNDKDRIHQVLLHELTTSDPVSEIVYRFQTRYVPRLIPNDIGAMRETEPSDEYVAKDPNDVLVITGGTGGIGLCLANYFADRGVQRMVLMGTNKLPQEEMWEEICRKHTVAAADPNLENQAQRQLELINSEDKFDLQDVKKISQLLKLKQKGIQVELYFGPLTEKKPLMTYFNQITKKYGRIFGIIHCAGVDINTNPAFIHKQTDHLKKVFEPKIDSLLTLHDVFKDHQLDFFMLFSSIAASIPELGVGISDYASANAFMDYFADYQFAKGNTYYSSINWPIWKTGGLNAKASKIYREIGLRALSDAEGLSLFNKIISRPTKANYMPYVMNVDQFEKKYSKTGKMKSKRVVIPKMHDHSTLDRLHVKNKKAEGSQETISWLKELVASELKLPIEGLDEQALFGDLGVDSILLAEIIKKIERKIGHHLEPSIFFDYSTISSLSTYLDPTFGSTLHPPREIIDAISDRDEADVHPDPVPISILDPSASVRKTSGNPDYSKADPPIAIIGMACHLPGAQDTAEFWQNLKNGVSSITEIPASRWRVNDYYHPQYAKGKSISKWGGFIENIEWFDPEYFDIKKTEASHIDPLVRQSLEVSAQAFANAGYKRDELWNQKVGVFIGSRSGYFSHKIKTPLKHSITGIGQNFIAAYISHIYNLRGPNLVVDTACSSSLVSIHLACQSLMQGECEMAIAGGVDILLDEKTYILLSEGKALAPDGRCKTFDESANGFVPGEGCGVVILKPLPQAIQAGDQILAVIDTSTVNNDGHTMGITSPNPNAQRELIEDALKKGQIDPETVTYLEAHGTGTMIGDPIELKALTQVFQKFTQKHQFCGIGSVKTNIGHVLSAAGIASVIKVVLAIQNRTLPPTINFSNPNPRFEFKKSPFYPVLTTEPWLPQNQLRRAGISSFGFGGTNAHIIISEFLNDQRKSQPIHRKPLPPIDYRRDYYWVDQDESVKNESVKNESIKRKPLLRLKRHAG